MTTTIDDILAQMDQIVDDTLLGASRLGYFAALYRRVTRTIKDLLGQGYFDDDARMERLDVVFASRYLDALRDYVDRGPACTAPWVVALDAAADHRAIVLQQLMVGMNAHIELDLGVACAQIAPGDALPGLRGDFVKINTVLAALSPIVEQEIGALSPAIALAERIGEAVEKPIVDTGMLIARSTAWKVAETLAPLQGAALEHAITARADEVAGWGRELLRPPLIARVPLRAVGLLESKDIRAIVTKLAEPRSIDFQGHHYKT